MSHILHKLKWILLAVLLVFCLIVIFQNIESIEVRLLMWSFHLPQAALLISTLAIGYLMGLLTPLSAGSPPGVPVIENRRPNRPPPKFPTALFSNLAGGKRSCCACFDRSAKLCTSLVLVAEQRHAKDSREATTC